LEKNFPELRGKVTGDNLPPPPLVALLLKFLTGVQLFGMVVALLGSNVFSYMGFRQVPSWYYSVEKNGVQLAILVYLLLPQVLSKYLVTGAFEIILDGSNTIYSKIATGRLPQLVEILEPLVAAGLKQVQEQQ
jgi:selT/selW/selH-like putative selenoprotein